MAVVPPATATLSVTVPDLHWGGMGRSVPEVVPPDTGMGALVVELPLELPVDEQAAKAVARAAAMNGVAVRLATGLIVNRL